MTIFLTLQHYYCSRVIDARSPKAIVIPAKGSSLSRELRDGDISWHDFRERVKGYKYGIEEGAFSIIAVYSHADALGLKFFPNVITVMLEFI